MSTNIILTGDLKTLKANIALAICFNRLIDSKDIGQFVGIPLEEAVTALPQTVRLRITMYNKRNPPYKAPIGGKLVRATYNIPDIQKEKILDWKTIKSVCGGSEGFSWGRYIANANLSNGRSMQAHGGTSRDAEDMLARMLTLTTATVLTKGVIELKEEGRRAPGQPLYRTSTRVYPAFCSIISSKRINDVQAYIKQSEKAKGVRSKLRGDYVEQGSEKILLWRDEPPPTYNRIVTNAFSPVSY